jgi:hypothetical protein
MRFGIERDHPEALPQFDSVAKHMIYYADVSAELLRIPSALVTSSLISRDKETLMELESETAQVLFNPLDYSRLRDRPMWKMWGVHVLAIVAAVTKLGGTFIKKRYPDVAAFWDGGSGFHKTIQRRFGALLGALERGDRVLLVSHSLGTVICYEFLWELSHTSRSRYRAENCRVDTFVTLGSPLADESVKHNLRGWHRAGRDRFPTTIRRWINIAAEDDCICHDPTVANDFREMTRLGLVDQIRDLRICNPALREGQRDPHSVIGYLIHPTTSEVIATWLAGGSTLGNRDCCAMQAV